MNKISPSSEGRFRFLIQERIKNFWGYGTLEGDVWLVGMEEGCDGSIFNLIRRFEATSHGEACDIYEDMQDSEEHLRWFREGAPTQATYRKLIYLLLYFQTGKVPTLEDIREYQINHFGRKKNNHAVLELMPLPAKSLKAKDWVYASSGIVGLASRREYLSTYKPERVKRLRELIREYKPKIVVCYSMVYLDDWRLLTDTPLAEVMEKKLYIAKDDHTLYAVVPHSVARGMMNNDWKQIAETILKTR
jgi:hypothetical protein